MPEHSICRGSWALAISRLAVCVFAIALIFGRPSLADQLSDGLSAYGNGDYSTALQDLMPLAEAGNPAALTTLAIMYEKGQGTPYSYGAALNLLQQAYAAGSYDALAEMGNMYRNGYGVDQDYDKAAQMFQEAAQHGSLRGQSYLGEAYATGQGVPVDYEHARSLFEDAATRGWVDAIASVGNLYLAGHGVPKDAAIAARYYSEAADRHSALAMNNLGLLWQKGLGVPQDQSGALSLFERAALLGEDSGAYNAGWAYENGIGTAPDLVQAYKWYEIGANEGGKFSALRRDLLSTQLTTDQIQQAKQQQPASESGSTPSSGQQSAGQTQAATTAGSLQDGQAAYDRGDYATALQIWTPLAEQGGADAQTELGMMYAQGQGVPRDDVTAAQWDQRAADQGNAVGEYALGVMYSLGEGVPQNLVTAANLIGKSAEQGNPFAEDTFGLIYEKGIGVGQDYILAEKWYGLAAAAFPVSDTEDRDKATKDRDRVAAILASEQAPAQTSTAPQQDLKVTATGSGFYLSNAALLLTNYHVVKDCKAVSVPGGPVSIQGVDPQNDLALLLAPPRSGGVAFLRVSPAVRAGERVVAVGFPLTGILAEQANVTTGDVSSLAGIGNDSRYLQITAPVQPGNSGGPLFDASGNIIGVVSAKLDAVKVAGVTGDIPENVNFALNVSVVRAFLDSRSISYQTATSATELSAPDIGDRGKGVTELVKCWQ